jgi:alpha-tubulin suppressor-like RCC1 family protein
VSAIASGGYHGLALTTTGHILAWGLNENGQLGCRRPCIIFADDLPVRMKLPAGTKVTAVAAGFFHSLILTRAGHILACGANLDGQLGDGTNTDSRVLVRVRLAAGLFATALARGPNAKQSLAIVHRTG